MMIKKSCEEYLEYLVRKFYNNQVILKENVELEYDDLDTIYELGYNLFTYGKYEEAKKVFGKLTTESPYTGYFWRALGAVNQQLQDYDEAIAAYNMAVANDEIDIVNYVYRGESKILSGEIDDAIEDFKTVIKIGDANLWVERSKFLLEIHGMLKEEELKSIISKDKIGRISDFLQKRPPQGRFREQLFWLIDVIYACKDSGDSQLIQEAKIMEDALENLGKFLETGDLKALDDATAHVKKFSKVVKDSVEK